LEKGYGLPHGVRQKDRIRDVYGHSARARTWSWKTVQELHLRSRVTSLGPTKRPFNVFL